MVDTTIQANGTEAKDVAIYFMEQTNKTLTSKEVSKTIGQVKTLMLKGYTKTQIIDTIDYVIALTSITMYSFGYVVAVIDDTLKRIADKKQSQEIRLRMEEEQKKAFGNEVNVDGESTERNRNKAGGFGTESRFGEKYNFDLLEGNRKAD